jgi:hypothetical protein
LGAISDKIDSRFSKEFSMTENLQAVIDVIERLSPNDQLEVIVTVSRGLQKQYQPNRVAMRIQEFAPVNLIPAEVRRSAPLKDLLQLKADFWPDDETADDINSYLEQQRRGYCIAMKEVFHHCFTWS